MAAAEERVEDVLHVDEGVEIVPHVAADERHQFGRAAPRIDPADEHLVLAADGHLLHHLIGVVIVHRHQAVVEMDTWRLDIVLKRPTPSGLRGGFTPQQPGRDRLRTGQASGIRAPGGFSSICRL